MWTCIIDIKYVSSEEELNIYGISIEPIENALVEKP